MVTDQARWVLGRTKIDPLKVAKAWQITEEECWEYLNDLTAALNAAEKAYNAPETQKELREWISTIPDKNEVRRAVLTEQLNKAKKYPNRYDVPRLLREVKLLTGKLEDLSPESIAIAKDYPIAQLLNVTRKGNISCPFHKDKTPSFQITKRNTFTCYSCGEYGDVIDLYQKLHHSSFLEAVKALGG